jgi:hypothetical protein
MTPGDSTLELVEDIVSDGVEHIILLMRHSAREFEPGRHDLLNPLTDEGRELARNLGEKLPKSLLIRGYSSPAERCVETADLIMEGHKNKGGEISRNRVIEALGVFYVLDQMKMFMAMREAGSQVAFIQKWIAGNVREDILMPPDLAAKFIGRLIAEKLGETSGKPQLDLMVSHDFTLYTIKDRLLGQNTHTYPEVHFLDGIAFYEKNGKTYIRSHHEAAIELDVSLNVSLDDSRGGSQV